ncbi:hypothetical protein LUX12_03955 [Streptomyces somaliensis]|uniref:hypothetical protein n=1 Tax=Streptomyces somaliensis TaxID=78355 RepID=UPI0020CBFED4|nr:hypothetical protein [Streptomyces somaliensis]MCP9944132.1 hypothetical protein [Streptomyces somaliensis]MCP9962633.1 hypothetical protein [Streptomyces somaliensis]MCP9975464.1 hypothetical protein [Streptomyces somaliensis]
MTQQLANRDLNDLNFRHVSAKLHFQPFSSDYSAPESLDPLGRHTSISRQFESLLA